MHFYIKMVSKNIISVNTLTADKDNSFEDNMTSNVVDKYLALRKMIVKSLKTRITKLGTFINKHDNAWTML